MGHKSVTIPESFLSKFNPTRFWGLVKQGESNECWPFLGKMRSRDGYGRILLIIDSKRHKVAAHRFGYQLLNGPISDIFLVCHSCDNRICCNPYHWVLGTPQSNSSDMIRKGRSLRGNHWHFINKDRNYSGQNNPQAKYSNSQLTQVHNLLKQGYTVTKIATITGVHRGTVSSIKHQRHWSTK